MTMKGIISQTIVYDYLPFPYYKIYKYTNNCIHGEHKTVQSQYKISISIKQVGHTRPTSNYSSSYKSVFSNQNLLEKVNFQCICL